jgi:hypothetical protein
MIYYKKNDSIYYQFDPVTLTYREAFISNTQKRITEIRDEKLYNDALTRVQGANLESADEPSFTSFLNNVKSLL